MTFNDVVGFLQSVVPSHVEVVTGENDMVQLVDHGADAQAYIRYSGGLDFSLQGVRGGEKLPTKKYTFRNEHELMVILAPKVLSCLDGERRI